ncbi:MAG: hypothetical protein AB7F89_05285 [Pirellulaceae bacterium]
MARLAVGFVLCGAAVWFAPATGSLAGRAQAQEPNRDDPFDNSRPSDKPAAPEASRKQTAPVPGLGALALPPDDASTAIECKLARRQPAKYEDVPLEEVLRDVSQRYGFDFFVRRGALEDSGISLDQPVTLQLASVTGRVLLDLLLADHDLVHTIHDGFVVITTEDDIESYFVETRVYDCTALRDAARSLPGASIGAGKMPGKMGMGVVGMPGMGDMSGMGGMPGMGMGGGMGMEGGMGPHEKFESSASSLVDLIQTTISPQTWQAMGGASSIALWNDRALVVRTTPLVHRELSKLLRELQAMQPVSAKAGGVF